MSAHAMIYKPEYRIISLHFLSLEKINLFRKQTMKLCLLEHEFMDDLKLFPSHTITTNCLFCSYQPRTILQISIYFLLLLQLLRNRKLIIRVVIYALGHEMILILSFSFFFTVALRATTNKFFYKFSPSLSLSLYENSYECKQLLPTRPDSDD